MRGTNQTRKGNVLFLVLFTVMMLSLIATTFVMTSTLDFKISTTCNNIVESKLLADAGINFAISQLICRTIKQTLFQVFANIRLF